MPHFECPHCRQKLASIDKLQRDGYIERAYQCKNPNCPSVVKTGLLARVLTREKVERVYYAKPNGRRKRLNYD